jgi:uncharacterized protein
MALAGTPLGSLVEQHRDQIVALVLRHRARSIAVFGSVARGEDTGASDVDFLVDFEPGSSLLDLIHLEEALAELLGVSVDVVSTGALLERDHEIRRDAVPL